MRMKDDEQQAEQGPVDPAKQDRTYSEKHGDQRLDFDPLKDLNLPADYDEVLARFKRLQGDRAMEALN